MKIGAYDLIDDTTGLIPSARVYLDGAAPNPFNPSTAIHFYLSVDGMTSLKVYDVTGNRVRTLTERAMSQGRHEALWDGRDEQGRASTVGCVPDSIAIRIRNQDGENVPGEVTSPFSTRPFFSIAQLIDYIPQPVRHIRPAAFAAAPLF